ncbi:2Fe-2S iron-sulfur cluster binding domain-containing protein (plasmid) [Kovacikia minuta CCNUW1]|uniref:2Fe-2S iron-sulfur cluster-binding protein n=1 Tax=Kovacikia minuta TaxID=2931930 RepID=UPI001CCACCA5|nr:2Fe-2S iron-sulfur cluster-binding protein [Kovacikia minuta]UBF30043.1 2Fe-2S iron-sulfur cluster binding domain-containing protein [Kovacikia minuta CCNUW1]
MFESLGRIRNPWVRSLTAAFTTYSAIALVSSVAIGATNSKSESAYRTALTSSLIGICGGALFGLTYTGKGSQRGTAQTSQQQPDAASNGSIWKDWRNFVVVRKVKESEEITSFYLEPEDKGEIPDFQPGQFLTIKLNIPGQPKPVIRTYSLSDYASPCTYYRLSIKREPMPRGLDVPPGVASNFMHDQVHEGAVILAKPPSGKFILDVQKSLPAVLISNGVGITPMISMAKAAIRSGSNRPIWFVHGARDGRFHAFRDEVKALVMSTNGAAQTSPNLHVHFVYSRPSAEDEGHYHSTGYVDTALVRSLIQQDAEYFLCGSPAFMQSLREGLQTAGVPKNRVFFESFGKAMKASAEPEMPTEVSNGNLKTSEIVFAKSDKTVTWQPGDNSILEFAEANDLEPPYSCRQGICGTCMCKILEGEVDYQATPVAEIEPGSVLICISQPKTAKVVLDL